MKEYQFTPEELKRRPSPQFNGFRSWVENELKRRKGELGGEAFLPSSPFVRLTSCSEDTEKKYAFFTLGLHGFNNHASKLNIFNLTYGDKDIVGYATDTGGGTAGNRPVRFIAADELTAGSIPPAVAATLPATKIQEIQAQRDHIAGESKINVGKGISPMPGITNMRLTRRDLGAPLTVAVEWVCYNRTQLEFLRNHFLMAGRYVVIEWGNMYVQGAESPLKTLDFTKTDDIENQESITDILSDVLLKGRKRVIDEYVRPNNGNYDFVVGMIGNYTVTIDPKTNTYTCTTNIVSMGENMWGFNLNGTVTNKETEESTAVVSAFNDFFKVGSDFDKLVELCADQPKLVAKSEASFAKESQDYIKEHNPTNSAEVSTNPEDYRFVSWKFFAVNVMHHLFNYIKNPTVKVEMMQYLRLAPLPEDELKDDRDWVGDNVHLLSTSADTMLLIKRDTPDVPKGFTGNGYFDDFPGANAVRGKLTKGVWLNVGMIRRAFLTHNTFMDALKNILSNMNNATENYWQLQMFYDELEHVYRVIDKNSVDNSKSSLPRFYKFNVGGKGELLELNLDSAFPPELVTQLAMFAQFQTSTAPVQQDLLNRYPSLGTTSTFIFSLNWTNLTDVVGQKMQSRLKPRIPVDQLDSILVAPDASTPQFDRWGARLAGSNPDVLGHALAVSKTGAPPKKNASVANVPIPDGAVVNIPQISPVQPGIVQRAAKNNNPGNIKKPDTGPLPRGAIGTDDQGYVQFATPSLGFAAIVHQVAVDQARDLTVTEFSLKYISDATPEQKAQYISEFCVFMHCIPSTRLSTLDTVTVARFIAQKDSSTTLDNAPAKVYNTDPSTLLTDPKNQLPDPIVAQKADDMAKANNVPRESADVVSADTKRVQEEELQKKKDDVMNRYGDSFMKIIEFTPSVMRNKIARDGFVRYPVANSFVCPFPVTTSVTFTLPGISGLSVSDGFYVDRLPFVFEQYGCFQITEINESVTPQGWVTSVKGMFRLLFLNGEGFTHSSEAALSHTQL